MRSAYKWFFKARPMFIPKNVRGIIWFYARTWRYQRVHGDHRSFLRDEEGLLNGPGAKACLTWRDVTYPKGDEHEPTKRVNGKLVKLRIPRRIWSDDVGDAIAIAGAE